MVIKRNASFRHNETRFQVMPDLRSEEYEKLKESIAERGVLVPIEKDVDTGEVLDGFHRMRACEELGIEPPVIERHFGSDAERKVHAFTLNLARRQLGPVSWGRAFESLLEARGVKTGSGARNDQSSATMTEVTKEAGVAPRTAERRRRLARDLEDHPEIAEQVDRGEITPMEGRRRAGIAKPRPEKTSDSEPEFYTVEDMYQEAAETGASIDLPSKEMSAAEKAGFGVREKLRSMMRHDPRESASVHNNRIDPNAVETEIRTMEDFGEWREKYLNALKEKQAKPGSLKVVESGGSYGG